MPGAISFDFWNTLYADGAENKRRELRKDYFAALLRNYREIEPVEIEHAFSVGSKFFLDNWINHSRTPTAAERIRFMANSLDISVSEEHIHTTVDYFGQMIFEVRPQEIPLVKEVIPLLNKKYPLGIISDTGFISGQYIRKFLDRENLLNYFSSLVFSDESKHSKPHVSVFQKTCDKLGVQTKDLMHIGDLERTDVAGANNSGCISVKFKGVQNDTSHNGHAKYVISDYRELHNVISF